MSVLSGELLVCFDDSSVGRLFSLVNIQTSEVAHKDGAIQRLLPTLHPSWCPLLMTNLTPANP